jgi:hypothetical protein
MINEGVGNMRPINGQGFYLPSRYEDPLAIENEQNAIKPEKAVALLKAQGIDITPEQAEAVLEWLDRIADIIVSQFLQP